jgi:hypothetical protein
MRPDGPDIDAGGTVGRKGRSAALPAQSAGSPSPVGVRMRIVYSMEVVDPVARPDGVCYVRRFSYETREEAWAKYAEAIRFGFAATVEEVGRGLRVTETAPA